MPDSQKKSVDDSEDGFLRRATKKSHFPLILSEEEMAKHMRIVAGGGYGQKDQHLSLLYRSMVCGGGALYLNMHGDLGLTGSIIAWADKINRKEDVISLAFPKAAPLHGDEVVCFNPFESMDALTSAKSIVLGADGKVGRSSDFFVGRSMEMHRSVLSGLFWLRDNLGLYVDAQVIQDHLNFEAVIALSERQDIPDEHLQGVRDYLKSILPLGEGMAKKQHALIQMMSTERLRIMTKEYPGIFTAGRNDIDFSSVIAKRQIVVVTFPSLTRNAELNDFLSSLVLNAFDSCVGKLFHKSEKNWDESNSAVKDKYPMFLVMSTDDRFLRGSNLCQAGNTGRLAMVLATEDFSCLSKLSAKEGKTILSNASTKFFMPDDKTGSK
ncbi:hypothetical protein CSR02_15790 [Acetobacter pomorum]|uniref:Uncharacterized protein n=1 Tax=Acetobacter pomorum TaxID=65959 RepID=A0A2G4R7X9_9PROT|nr:hypothetical protein [Acetobacter pomorum]PHY92664.1 hypothetical protein CSR02_15790 [Acetobacter pomorum]GBR47642.1 hypothetical protein AA11825_0733 [Acetobacter pomorum DSM 11825]